MSEFIEVTRKQFIAATTAVFGFCGTLAGIGAGGSVEIPAVDLTGPSSVGLGLGAAAVGAVSAAVFSRWS